jgi:hypothetical protein
MMTSPLILVLFLLSLTCMGAGLLIPRMQERARQHAEQERYRCWGHGLTYEPLRECVYQQGRAWKRARLCFECAVAREAMPISPLSAKSC